MPLAVDGGGQAQAAGAAAASASSAAADAEAAAKMEQRGKVRAKIRSRAEQQSGKRLECHSCRSYDISFLFVNDKCVAVLVLSRTNLIKSYLIEEIVSFFVFESAIIFRNSQVTLPPIFTLIFPERILTISKETDLLSFDSGDASTAIGLKLF